MPELLYVAHNMDTFAVATPEWWGDARTDALYPPALLEASPAPPERPFFRLTPEVMAFFEVHWRRKDAEWYARSQALQEARQKLQNAKLKLVAARAQKAPQADLDAFQAKLDAEAARQAREEAWVADWKLKLERAGPKLDALRAWSRDHHEEGAVARAIGQGVRTPKVVSSEDVFQASQDTSSSQGALSAQKLPPHRSWFAKDVPGLVAWLASLAEADLPPGDLVLARSGPLNGPYWSVRAEDRGRWLARLQSEAASGPCPCSNVVFQVRALQKLLTDVPTPRPEEGTCLLAAAR